MIDQIVNSTRRTLKYGYLRVVRNRATPQSTAMGFAVGVFVGFLPIIPFQTIAALFAAFVLRCGKVGAVLGTWVTNPLNAALLYYLFYKIGSFLLPVPERMDHPDSLELSALVQKGWDVAGTMAVGGLVLAFPAAIAAYFLTLSAIRRYHQVRGMRLKRKQTRHIR